MKLLLLLLLLLAQISSDTTASFTTAKPIFLPPTKMIATWPGDACEGQAGQSLGNCDPTYMCIVTRDEKYAVVVDRETGISWSIQWEGKCER